MISLIFYVAVAVFLLVIAGSLVHQGRKRNGEVSEDEKNFNLGFWNDSGLDLAEQIFDPGDYRWLNDELGFPELARELARQRKAMALTWLRCLRTSFNELVRVPRSAEMSRGEDNASTGWAMTLLTLRFQFLLAYAMMVVWVFGPYTRITPSFGWVRPLLSRGTHKEQYGLRV